MAREAFSGIGSEMWRWFGWVGPRCWCRRSSGDGRRSYRLGHELVDEFLEFASGRCRPNTVRAYAHDLKVFFEVVGKDPCDVTSRDVLAFVVAQQRPRPGAENVVRISDGGAGLSASTIKRRLAAVSSLFGYLVVRGDAGVASNPVPRGMPTRRSRHRDQRGVPLVRGVRRLPQILEAGEVDALLAALRTTRDRAIVEAMLLGGLRRCEVLGLRLEDLRLGEWRVFIADGKGGHQRLVPISQTFFTTVAAYLNDERPADAATDRVFVALKGAAPRAAVVGRRARRGPDRGARTGRAGGRDVSRVAPHLLHPAAASGDADRSDPSPGRSPLDRVDPGLSPSRRRLARRRVSTRRGSDRGASDDRRGPMSAQPAAGAVAGIDRAAVAAARCKRSPGPRSPPGRRRWRSRWTGSWTSSRCRHGRARSTPTR